MTSNHVTRHGGKVTYVGLRTIDNREGLGIAMNRNGSIEVVSVEHEGKKRIEKKEIYPVVYGATVRARDGETVALTGVGSTTGTSGGCGPKVWPFAASYGT